MHDKDLKKSTEEKIWVKCTMNYGVTAISRIFFNKTQENLSLIKNLQIFVISQNPPFFLPCKFITLKKKCP